MYLWYPIKMRGRTIISIPGAPPFESEDAALKWAAAWLENNPKAIVAGEGVTAARIKSGERSEHA